jgi:hypothetical protein
MFDLIDNGLGGVDIRADFGTNGSVVGGNFMSEESTVSGFTFYTSLTLPSMEPQPVHDPTLHPD